MGKVFISYRRDDSIDIAGRIDDRLQAHFGRNQVFIDQDTIPFGADFRDHIRAAVTECDVLLAIVGRRWLDTDESGRRRLHERNDFVRFEIATALASGIPVVPVLTGGVSIPRPEDLPENLKDFAYRNAATVSSDRDFHSHMNRLVEHLEELFSERERQKAEALKRPAEQPKKKATPKKKAKTKTKHKCPQCKKKFSTPSGLQHHIRDMHPDVSSNAVKPHDEFTCSKCKQTFSTSSARDQHMTDKHGPESKATKQSVAKKKAAAAKAKPPNPAQWPCPVCGQKFQKKKSRDDHIQSKHAGAATGGVNTSTTARRTSARKPFLDKLKDYFVGDKGAN